MTDRIGRLRLAEQSLCFGRIDSTEQGAPLHIGRLGLRTDAGELLLLDWRAEAARPFYSATMASPMGVHRRRHLRLNIRRVVDVSDEILDGATPTGEDVVGDGPLVAALSGARTGRMREAAATLQTEQDEIVRSPHRGIMVVDGDPGTGKTIVALHRAAYVLHDAGFKHQKVGEQIFNATYTTQDWLGRLATSSAVGAHPDAQKAELILRRLSDDLGGGSEEHMIEHRAWWVLARPSA